MDKNYVIDITDNIDDLNRDMMDWSMLPTDFKLMSNDSCIEKYGCTVTDLYNKLKNTILNKQEFAEDRENNNAVIESAKAFIDMPHYEELINKSNLLQHSPFVVIINPDETKESLAAKYNTFLSLDSKYRRISDYYSWDIWGYNVYNMYDIVATMIDDEKEDEPNLVFGEVANLDSCFEGSYDFLNKADIEGDILTIAKFKQNCKSDRFNSPIFEAAFDNKLKFIKTHEASELIFPKVVPWFTAREMNDYCSQCKIDQTRYYYQQLKEASNSGDKNNLLALGWNPTVPINEDSIATAMQRQLQEANNVGYYDITKLANYDPKDYNLIRVRDLVVRPIYFVFFSHPKEENTIDAAVAFPKQFELSTDLGIMYGFKHSNGIFSGFEKITREEMNPKEKIEVVSIFVDNEAYEILYNNIINNPDAESIGGKQFNSIYSVLFNSRNMLDPDRRKITYSYYIDMLLKLICFNSETDEIVDPHFIDARLKTIFLMYKGEYGLYDQQAVSNIMRVICDDVNLEKYLKANEFELDRELINKLKTRPCIYSTTD